MTIFACVMSVAGVLNTASGQTQEVKDVLSRLKGPALVWPEAETDSVPQVAQRITAWLLEFEAGVDEAVRARVAQLVTERRKSISEAEAWDELGAAIFLQGDAGAAAWCALESLTLESSDRVLTNCGVYFIYLGRLTDALLLLHAAYAQGYRSASLLEALSQIHRKKGDIAAARRWIALAAATDPDDVVIHVEKSLAETGAPPPDDQEPEDENVMYPELSRAMAELEQHARRVILEITQLSMDLDQIEQDAEAKQYRDALLEITYEYIAVSVLNASRAVDRARMTLEEYQQTVYGGPGSRESYGHYQRALYNQAILACIYAHCAVTGELLTTFSGRNVDGPGWHARFWGEVVRIRPVLLMADQKLRWDHPDAREALSNEPGAQWRRLDWRARVRFESVYGPSDRKATEEARACVPGPDNEACQIKAYRAHCRRAEQAFQTYVNESELLYQRAANQYQRVAIAMMWWGQRELVEFDDYASRYYALLKLSGPGAAALAAGGVNEKQMHHDLVNLYWNELVNRVIDRNQPSWGVAQYLQEEAQWFVRDRQDAMEHQASLREMIERSVPFGGCSEVERRFLEILAQEAWEEYLNELRETLASDFEVGYKPNVNCDFALGALTYNFDERGLSSGEFKIDNAWGPGLDGKFKTMADGWPAVSIGGGTSDSWGIFAGSTDFSVFTEKNERTGKFDGGVSLSGKLGFGPIKKRKMFGKSVGLGVACYPGEVVFKVHARAAFEDAVALITATAKGPP